LVGAGQPGQDRQARGVGGGPAEGAEGVSLHVPDRRLVGVPPAVGVFAGPRRPIELVGDVVVHVVDEQVRIAAVVDADLGAVLVIALDDCVGGDGRRLDVALARVGVDDDGGFRRAVAVYHVVGDAVQVGGGLVILAEVGVELAVAVGAEDAVHDRGGVGGRRGAGYLLVPRVVGGE